ncbi:MAG TPA: SGNH/GDSL hydrolase family protein [Polyangia bacterium]|nr:SGNH/GDSL hydrolase family protein [Polyangia bacterium]
MARSAPVACIAGTLAALAGAAGCDGQMIRLGTCPHAEVPASQVVWIGDSWVLVPNGEPHTGVRDLARAAGAIGPSDDYTIDAVAAAPMVVPSTNGGPAPIPTQYSSQEAGATKVKVLIMDGGTWDTITNNSSATVTDVADSFKQLLSTVASDGTVTDVIYYLMPELSSIPGVAALRPLLEQVCTQSPVPCHFLDLQPIWTDPSSYNTSGSPPVPTDSGATVIADAIWSIMQTNCIGQ